MLRFAGHEKKTDYSVNPTEIVIFAHQNTSTMYAAGTIHNNGETVSYPAKERLFFDTFFQKTACRYLFSNHCGKISCIDISRFTFTGKERDPETGYSHFGARYYDNDLSGLFLSVDPMSDKYPRISPYAYCAWNPVKLVDQDGMEFDPASQEIVNRFKSETVDLMESMDCTPEKRKEYDAALKEIAQLEKSNQMYHITIVY